MGGASAGIGGTRPAGGVAGTGTAGASSGGTPSVGGSAAAGGGGVSAGTAGTGGSAGDQGGANTSGVGGNGGAPSGGTAGAPALVMPIDRGNGRYVLEYGTLQFEVDAKVGARIVSFSLSGTNVLTGPDAHESNYGSTLSLSPQNGTQGSGWPPPAAMDTEPYSVDVMNDEIVMTSDPVAVGGGTVRVTKRFSPDFEKGGIVHRYTIENVGSGAVSWAAWQITRALPNGITFFPSGTTEGPTLELPLKKEGGWSWWRYSEAEIDAQPYGDKSMADGSGGWLAHAASGVLFLKTFPDVPAGKQAPGDAEVSIYASKPGHMGQGAYVEIEPQSAYESLAAGAKLDWVVNWYLKPLPAGADLAVGDPELVSFVGTLLD